MTQKLVALLVLVGLVSSLWWFGRWADPMPAVDVTMPPAPAAIDAAGTRLAANEEAIAAAAGRALVTPGAAAEPGPTELWGRVVDAATQQPVGAARIDLLRRDADAFWNLDLDYGERIEELAHTTSDADGGFRFAVARASPHRLRVQAAGFAAKTALACTGGSIVVVELTRGGTLTGVVRCEGQPVAEADVRIAVRGQVAELAAGMTDASGAFRLAGLPAAEAYVQVASRHCAEHWSHVTLGAGGQQHVEIDLPKGTVLRGRVLDAATEAPIAGARVADSWTMRRAVRTDADGRFELDGLVAASHLMAHVRADGHTAAAVPVGTRLGDDLVVRLARGGEVRGRVVDADGRPVGAAYVGVCVNFSETPGMQGADWIPARVDANGTFVAAGLRSDLHYWLMARAPRCGMRTYALPRALAEGTSCDVGDVVLRPAGGIEGRVLDDQGRPMANLDIGVRGHNGDAFAWLHGGARASTVSQFEGRSAHTDANGRFRFPDLAGGAWTVVLRRETHDQPFEQSVTLADGELVDGVQFVVPLGLAIAGRLLSVDGRSFTEWVHLEAVGEGERAIARASAKVGADGSFRLVGLEPGNYTIGLVVRPKGQVMAPVLHVAAGTEDLSIRLEQPSYVGGRVVDAAGKPVRANVYASFDGLALGSTFTLNEADGSFRLEVPAAFVGEVHAVPAEDGADGRGGLGGAEERGVTAGRMDLVLRWSVPATQR